MKPISVLRGIPIVVGTLLLVSVAVQAGSPDPMQHLAECARITDAAKRLDCYDALARRLSENPPGPDEVNGEWGVSVKVSPIDDTRTITLYLEATSAEPHADKPAFLFLRCRGGKTNAYITWNRRLANGEVMVRVGKEAAERQYWNLSTDNEATFYAGNSVSFTRKLMESDRLVAQVYLKGEGAMSAVFELKGLANAIAPLREGCGW